MRRKVSPRGNKLPFLSWDTHYCWMESQLYLAKDMWRIMIMVLMMYLSWTHNVYLFPPPSSCQQVNQIPYVVRAIFY